MNASSPSPGVAIPGAPRKLSPTEFASTVTAITSAFGDPTRRDIFLFAHESQTGVSVSEVAAKFGLHGNVARHHLDKLAAGGYLTVHVAKPSGGVGRPSKRYAIADEAIHLDVDVRQDDLLVGLLGRALKLLPAEVAEQMAEEVGYEYGLAMAESLDPAATQHSFRGALHTIADALSAHGFSARAKQDDEDEQLQIEAQNCPFGESVIEHPVICAVDRGIVQGMLSELLGPTSVTHTASRPDGSDVCVTRVEL